MGEQSNISYNFTLQDQLSQGVQIIARGLEQLARQSDQAGNSQARLQAALTQGQQVFSAFGAQANQAGQIVDRFGNVLGREAADKVRDFASQLQATGQQLQGLRTYGVGATETVGQLGRSFSVLQGALSVAGGLGIVTSVQAVASSLRDFGTQSIQVATQREALAASFRGITGSATAAQRELRFLRDEATRTSAPFEDLTRNYLRLTAASRDSTISSQDTRRVFQGLSAAGRTLGLTNVELNRSFNAITDIISKGKVGRDDLIRQLGNSLPGVLNITARAFGVSTEALNDWLARGITAEEFIRRFGPQLQREFGPGLAAATNTAAATFARLGNEIKDVSASIGQEILTLLQPAASALDRFLRQQREAREARVERSLERAGGPIEGGTPEEEAQLRRLGNLSAVERGPALAATRALIDQIREGIRARNAAGRRNLEVEGADALAGDIEGGDTPFVRQTEALRKARQEAEQQLARIQAVGQNAPAIFQGAQGELERQNALVSAQRQGLEAIAKIVAESPGLLKQLTPEFQAAFEALNKQYGAQVRLQEAAEATVKSERDAERAREQAARKAETDREQAARKAETDRERAIEQLGRLSAQLAGATQEERAEDIAAALAARFPNDAQIQAQAEDIQQRARLLQQSAEIVQAYEQEFIALKQAADARREAEDTQSRLNNAIQRAIDLARADRDERPEARLRAQFREAGVTPTPEQEFLIGQVSDITRIRQERDQIERIFADLGRDIEQNFRGVFEEVFSGGVQSARSFGLLVTQSLQRTFAQIASQAVTLLLARFAGVEASGRGGVGGGIGTILLGLAQRILPALAGGGVGAGAGGAGGSASGTGIDLSGGGGGFGSTITFAEGGIARRPTFALIGDDRAGFGEAVVPLTRGRAIPVEMRSQGQQAQTIVLNVSLSQDFRGAINPMSLRPTKAEMVQAVVEDVTGDGVARRVIMQYAGR